MKCSMILAVSLNGVIGDKGGLPWHLPEDLKYFRDTTLNHIVIMGRKTFESIGKPLPQRYNIVVTRKKKYFENLDADLKKELFPFWEKGEVFWVESLEEAFLKAVDIQIKREISSLPFLIGGKSLYREALDKKYVDKIYLGKIQKKYEGDVFFDDLDNDLNLCDKIFLKRINSKDGIEIEYFLYERRR